MRQVVRAQSVEIATACGRINSRSQPLLRRDVQVNGLANPPIRGNLQNGRTAEAAMSNQQVFRKALAADRSDHRG